MAWKRRSFMFALFLVFSLLLPIDRYSGVSLATDVVPDSFEPNDSDSTATLVQQNQTYAATVDSLEDVDYFKFTPTKNGRYHFTVSLADQADVQAGVYDANMTLVSAATKGNGATLEVEYTGTAGDVYYLKLSALSTGSYSLRLSEVMVTYQHDQANRLTSITIQRGSHLTQTKLQYDANGNLLQKVTTVTEVN